MLNIKEKLKEVITKKSVIYDVKEKTLGTSIIFSNDMFYLTVFVFIDGDVFNNDVMDCAEGKTLEECFSSMLA